MISGLHHYIRVKFANVVKLCSWTRRLREIRAVGGPEVGWGWKDGGEADVWAQYSIYLPVHYRRIKSLLFLDGTPFWDFFAA